MQTYNVKEISDLLNTNPETVRRWIRDGKLKAEQLNKKSGNLVSEDALKAFLKDYPKYARMVALTGGALTSSMGLPFVAGAAVSSILVELYANKKISKGKISSDEFTAHIRKCITESEKTIRSKEKTLNQIKAEIKTEREKVEELKRLLKTADFAAGIVDETDEDRSI